MRGLKKILFNGFLLIHCIGLFAQRNNTLNCRQQEVDYKIEVEMDVESAQYSGVQQITYTNHSPDTLDRVYFTCFLMPFSLVAKWMFAREALLTPTLGSLTIQKQKEDQGLFKSYRVETRWYFYKQQCRRNHFRGGSE